MRPCNLETCMRFASLDGCRELKNAQGLEQGLDLPTHLQGLKDYFTYDAQQAR